MKNGKPVLAFLGHSRCGKDTAAEWFDDNTSLVYWGGCSWSVRDYMAARLSDDAGREITEKEAYATRHACKDKWFKYCNEYREQMGQDICVRRNLEDSDIVCGIRSKTELETAIKNGLIDLSVWIKRDVPQDPTLEFNEYDCDISILNTTTVIDFYARLYRLAIVLNLLNKGEL